MDSYHVPVMLSEVEEYLINSTSGCYVDCTLGGGGHTAYLLGKYPKINIVALDCDEDAINASKQILSEFSGRIRFFRENFRNLKNLLDKAHIDSVDGVLVDLGVSSWQLNNADRGFSFKSDTLDMRMDTRIRQNAGDLLNSLGSQELADIFYRFGEETLSRQIGKLIEHQRSGRSISSAKALCSIVEKVKKKKGRINPSTKIFQALRIAVNSELENLSMLLDVIPKILKTTGRVVFISYHSLEDRLVKQSFKKLSEEGVCHLLTKKVVCPRDEELAANPRSRSAKLRAVEKL